MKTSMRLVIVGLLAASLVAVTVVPALSRGGEPDVKMDVSVETGVRASTKVQDDIRGISQDLILKNFRGDVGKSSMIFGETTILDEVRGGFRCETKATFLYQDTYTAVMNLIRWTYSRGAAGDVRTREDYVPDSEEGVEGKQGSKPSRQMAQKDETREDEQAKGTNPFEPDEKTRARTDADELRSEQVRTAWYQQARGFANCPVDSSYSDAWYCTYYSAYVMHWRTGKGYYARGGPASVYNNKKVFQDGGQLLYYNNIGHGCGYGLVMSDGWIYSSWVNYPPYKWGIVGAVLLVNSCNAYDNPLRSTFTANWPRVYISGVTPLYVGRSEWVDAWFWYYGLVQRYTATNALNAAKSAASSHGYPGQFGITGWGKNYTF